MIRLEFGDFGFIRLLREPDPKRWDPDPTMIASLPRRPGTSANSAPDDNLRRICSDGREYGDCLYRDNGQWRWRLASRPCARGYTSIASASCP